MKAFDIDNIQLNIQSPQVNVSDTLRKYIFSKIEKLGKIDARIEKCNIVLKELKSDVNKNYEVSAEIFIPGHALFATEKKENPRLSVRAVFDELRKQMVSQKEKSGY